MGEKSRIFNLQEVQHAAAIEKLVVESSPRRTFLTMILISSVIAALGLLNDSAAVVIGAMLVAPLLWPVLGIGMGLLVGDSDMIRLSLISIVLSVFIAVITAMVITLGYVPLGASNEILQSTNYGFMIPVAIAAGAAAALAISFETIKEAVSGIAISVALIPPLVSVGIGLGGTDWDLMSEALELFAINLGGVIATSYVVFWLLGFRRYHRTLKAAVKKEEKELKNKK